MSKDSEEVASLTPSVVCGGLRKVISFSGSRFLERKTVSTSSLHVEIEARVFIGLQVLSFSERSKGLLFLQPFLQMGWLSSLITV